MPPLDTFDLPPDFLSAVYSQSPSQGYTHNFYRYPARFSPEFARAAIRNFSSEGDLILDPFMGGGTTLVEALVSGRNAIGTDINSLAQFVTKTKTTLVEASDFDVLLNWLEQIGPRLNMHRPQERHIEWRDKGYQKHLPWRIRKLIEFILNEIHLLPFDHQRALARCALLRVGQWSVDNTIRPPSVKEIKAKLVETISDYAIAMHETVEAVSSLPVHRHRILSYNISAQDLNDSLWQHEQEKRVRLVLTSPPYPNVHVLYHRWQIQGRRETPSPYWITDCHDGHGYSYYTLGSRTPSGVDRYFSSIESVFRKVRSLLTEDATVIQLVAFSNVETHLPRYLEAMGRAGYLEMENFYESQEVGGRLWRQVPLRKWYASYKGRTSSSRELLLIHRPA